MLILIYADDGAGKSVQAKAIAESSDNAEVLSFAIKNRRLYQDSSVPCTELLKFNPDQSVNPYQTIDAFHDAVSRVIKESDKNLIVIDEITLLRTWAQPCAIEWWNRSYTTKITKIGESNALAWSYVNQITYGPIERLNTWAENNSCTIIAITNLADVRVLEIGDDGKKHSIATGDKCCAAKENIRKLADVRIRLELNGRKGRGYYAIFDKTQGWMEEGEESVKVDKQGVYTELVKRGAL